MYSHMSIQLRHLIESLAADAADVVPYAAVLLYVLAERGVTPEGLATFRALEGLLASVQAEVDLGGKVLGLVSVVD